LQFPANGTSLSESAPKKEDAGLVDTRITGIGDLVSGTNCAQERNFAIGKLQKKLRCKRQNEVAAQHLHTDDLGCRIPDT
jgi:hypothetical protein